MLSYLLSIGNTAERLLPDIFTALSCGAVHPVGSLSVFCLSENNHSAGETASLAADLSAAHVLMSSAEEESSLFPCSFSFSSCVPVFRSARELSDDSGDSLLISALRGKGIPFSCHTDREAVEWCVADLLSRPDDPSMMEFTAWLDSIVLASEKAPVRLTCMADLADPFSSGMILALLNHFRKVFNNRPVSVFMVALAATASPVPDTLFPMLRSSFQELEQRGLVCSPDTDSPHDVYAMWFLSIPSSMMESPDSLRFLAPFAAKILSSVCLKDDLPAPGLHTIETDGTLSLSMLDDCAPSFAAAVNLYVWLYLDLLPSLTNYLTHPSRLAVNVRASVFRRLLSDDRLADSTDLLQRTLRELLSRILAFMKCIPASLRMSPESVTLWQQAVEACGRTVTIAAEYNTARSEAKENGLDSVRPVHRDSLADTDEERLIRRIEDMKAQLDDETKKRDEILSVLGGFRSMQVRLDCLIRCQSALKSAQDKAAKEQDRNDRLSVLMLERRIRLLKAAVSWCEEELQAETLHTLSASPSAFSRLPDPYEGTVFDPAAAHLLESFLSPEGKPEPQSRVVSLFHGLPFADDRTRWRALQEKCKSSESGCTLPFILNHAMAICLEDLSSCVFTSQGDMPPLQLLPDLIPLSPLLQIRDILRILPGRVDSDVSLHECRGIFSMLVLRQYRRPSADDSLLHAECCVPGSSPVLAYWLETHQAEKVYILSLRSHEKSEPFALMLPGGRLIPAKRTASHIQLVPSFATWFDPDKNLFSDPCACLGEGDRLLLRQCIGAYLSFSSAALSAPLQQFLSQFLADLPDRFSRLTDKDGLSSRLRAVCGLPALPAYSDYITVSTVYYEHFLSEDIIGNYLLGTEHFPANICSDIPEEKLYSFRGVPFARDDSALLLDSAHAAGEDYVIRCLQNECSLLSEYSDDYRDSLVRNIQDLLDHHTDSIPEAVRIAEDLLKESQEPVQKREPAFEWPWDVHSLSMKTVLRECLGDELGSSAITPFSEFLAVFPARGNDVIGDVLLSSMCSIPPQNSYVQSDSESESIVPDAVLPPLSPAFAAVLCSLPEGRTLFRPGLFTFERNMNDTVKVTLTLDGVFPVRLIRVYTSDEILYLYSHDIPTVAVWPALPFPPEDWKSYFAFAHLTESYSVSAAAACHDFTVLDRSADGRCTAVFDSFPICFSLFRDDKSIGAVPNILPKPAITPGEPTCICVDFGSSGVSVVFATDHRREPLHGPCMVRTLLSNPSSSKEILRREFLPSVPVSALFPTVSRIFRNVPGADPVPFSDGIVLMSSDLQDLSSTPSDAVYTSLKWEEDKGRSGSLCLHQILLIAALQARCEGAPSVSWRFSLPDEMAKEGKEKLMDLFLSTAGKVMSESGYSSLSDDLSVSFASDSSALGAYFRCCAPDETRGGFIVLDLGSCTADISLFLRGREQAVRTCQIPLGVQYMFFPTLLKDPDLLSREFSFVEEPGFRSDLAVLSECLRSAGTDPVSLRRARIAFDYMISDHLPLMVSAALHAFSAGTPSKAGALLLLHLSYLMMLSGLVLLQIAADPGRNDFLPESMTLFLAGRGSLLMETLPPELKASLWHFLSMFRNRRVSSLSLLFSSEKKMEIPVGLSMLENLSSSLPPPSAVPSSVSVKPAELLPEFLLRFRKEYPASSCLLFPGFFTGDYYHPFTDYGEALLSASIDQSFPPADIPRPFDSLSAWPGNLMDLMS